MNASKEKIRLKPIQDGVKNQAEKNAHDIVNANRNQNFAKQQHNRGVVLNGNTSTAEAYHTTNGASQSRHQKQQIPVPETTPRNLITQSEQGGRSFVLATSTNSARHSENKNPPQSSLSSSSHNLPHSAPILETRSANGGNCRDIQGNNSIPLSTATFSDAGKDFFSQHNQYNHSKQHPFGQRPNHELTSDISQLHKSDQILGLPQHHQFADISSNSKSLIGPNQPVGRSKVQTVENTSIRRSAINPHFYDMNNTTSKSTTRPTPINKTIFSGTGGLANYNGNVKPTNSIMSYLKHSNNGFLETLKSSAGPASLTASRSVSIPSGSNIKKAPVSSVLSCYLTPDSLDINEPRKSKSKLEDSNDSDTGLSSMHSDETANMETLV